MFVAITVVEWAFAYGNPAFAIVAALLLVIATYVALSVVRLKQSLEESIDVLALVPLYVLFTWSLPWFFLNQQLILPAVYAVILALCFAYVYINEVNLFEIGFIRENMFK